MTRSRLSIAMMAMCMVGGGLPCILDASCAAEETNAPRDSTVGIRLRYDQLVLPGSELEVAPTDDQTPVMVEIEAVYPHGTDYRYDLCWYGLEPGEYDLRTFLRRKDGSSTEGLPALPIRVQGLLPAGHVQPHEVSFVRLPWIGGYRALLAAVLALWLLILACGIYRFMRRKQADQNQDRVPQISLADRLRPLVVRAVQGESTPAELAELERALLAYWRRRLGLSDRSHAEAMAILSSHPEASPLFQQLERWLYHPDTHQPVDVAALLASYEHLPDDEFLSEPTLSEAGT